MEEQKPNGNAPEPDDLNKLPMVRVDAETLFNLQRLASMFERMRLADYITYLNNPRRVIFMNFVAGLFRGLGLTLGATVLVALFLYTLGHMVDIPLIGSYIAKIVRIVQMEIGGGHTLRPPLK